MIGDVCTRLGTHLGFLRKTKPIVYAFCRLVREGSVLIAPRPSRDMKKMDMNNGLWVSSLGERLHTDYTLGDFLILCLLSYMLACNWFLEFTNSVEAVVILM
jgi:hypothetical protein